MQWPNATFGRVPFHEKNVGFRDVVSTLIQRPNVITVIRRNVGSVVVCARWGCLLCIPITTNLKVCCLVTCYCIGFR